MTLAAVVWLAACVVLLAGGVRALRHRAHLAAEQAALAGAQAADLGAATACARASLLARRNGARLMTCVLRARVCDVSVALPVKAPVPVGRQGLVVRARAGPAFPIHGGGR
jgi:secretion/DNA translocation related TadE-like protein